MQLRPRQEVFVQRCCDALNEHGNTLGIAPTGAGKTVMLSAIAGRYPGRALIVQHRDELTAQNCATYRRVNPRRSFGIFDAASKHWATEGGATFAMAPTLARNLEQFQRIGPHDLLVIDEAHHAVAEGFLKIVAAAREAWPSVRVLGVTATPERSDKRNLRAVFDNLGDRITLGELVNERFLVRPRGFVTSLGDEIDSKLKGVRKTAGDFDMDEVAAIIDRPDLNERVVDEWKDRAGDRQTVAFCSTVAHAEHVRDAFAGRGVRAAVVHGTMPEAERRDTLAAFDRGEIQVLTNCMVLTEGWDCQPVSCVLLLRPCSHRGLMVQMIGRGLRRVDPERYPDVHKDDCLVLDFGRSLVAHGGLDTALSEKAVDPHGAEPCPQCSALLPKPIDHCPFCLYVFPKEAAPVTEGGGAPKDKAAPPEIVLTEIELIERSPYRWVEKFGGLAMIASGFDAWGTVVSVQGRWLAIGGSKTQGIRTLADSADRMIALAAADDWMREHGDADGAAKTKRWLHEPPSEKQLAWLGLGQMQAIGITKYDATCEMTWRINERFIQNRVATYMQSLERRAA